MMILFISLSGAGDVLMATPLIREVRNKFPRARIDCLVMQGEISKNVLKGNKDINEVIYFNFMKEGFTKSLKFCNSLRKKRYDISITTYPQARYHYSIVSYLIGAKKRIGFLYGSEKLPFNRFFFSKVIRENFDRHVVENNLEVLRFLGVEKKSSKPALNLSVSKEGDRFAEDFFKKNGVKKCAIIHPGSGTTKNFFLKRWPEKRFVELCNHLKKDYSVVLIGGPEEADLRNRIIAKTDSKEKIFGLSENLDRTAAMIKKSDFLVTNDTVAGHVSAAVGTPVVSLFGPTSPKNTGPFTNKRVVVSKKPSSVDFYRHGSRGLTQEQARTMEFISLEDVIEGIKRLKLKK